MPALATASRSRSVARSACTIQSTPASAAARVEPAPREWMATRRLRRCASPTTAAISSLASICDLAGAAVRHLDEVDAVLALPAHLGDHLVGGVAELADRMVGRALPRRLVVLDAAIGDDHAAGDEHARPFHQAEPDGVAHADVGEPGAARHRDAGDARAQHLLHAAGRFERGEFRPRRALAFALALDQRIAVGHVAVGVDQAGHDPLAGGVDHLDVACGPRDGRRAAARRRS